MYAFLSDWQTLIAGILALAGAVITVRVMNRQAREAEERKRRSTRALLPSTLDAVYKYGRDSVRWLASVREKGQIAEKQTVASSPIPVNTCTRPDPGMLMRLCDGVEYLDFGVARFIADILSKIQVQHSRVESLQDYFENFPFYASKKVGIVRNIDTYIADSVEIMAFAGQIFPYARMVSDATPSAPGFDEVTAAFRDSGMSDFRDVLAWNEVTNRYPQETTDRPLSRAQRALQWLLRFGG